MEVIRKRNLKFSLLFGVFLVFIGCSPVKYVKPLKNKQHAASISMGGPLIGYGSATIPMPFLTANYGYGIDSSLTGFGAINITSAMFGNIQTELGITKQFIYQKKHIPSVSVTPVVNVIYRNKDAAKVYPQLAINSFWEYGNKTKMLYVSIDNWFELSSKKAFDIEQKNKWIFMPTLGHSFIGKKGNINFEMKVIAPNLSNQKLVVDYKTPLGNNGAFGVYIGYTYKFNER